MLLIEGKKVFEINLLRSYSSCRAPSIYQIEAITNKEVFFINGERFKAKAHCLEWYEGDNVTFVDKREFGACASARLLNLVNFELCGVWCE